MKSILATFFALCCSFSILADAQISKMLDNYETSVKAHLESIALSSIEDMFLPEDKQNKVIKNIESLLAELNIKNTILKKLPQEKLKHLSQNAKKRDVIADFHLDRLPASQTIALVLEEEEFPIIAKSHGKFVAKRMLKRMDAANAIARKAELLVFMALSQADESNEMAENKKSEAYKSMIRRSIAKQLPSINAAKSSHSFPFVQETELKAAYALTQIENQQEVLAAFQDKDFIDTYIGLAESVNVALDEFLTSW